MKLLILFLHLERFIRVYSFFLSLRESQEMQNNLNKKFMNITKLKTFLRLCLDIVILAKKCKIIWANFTVWIKNP